MDLIKKGDDFTRHLNMSIYTEDKVVTLIFLTNFRAKPRRYIYIYPTYYREMRWALN